MTEVIKSRVKWFFVGMLFVIMFVFTLDAFAGGGHTSPVTNNTTNNYNAPAYEGDTSGISEDDSAKGDAIAICIGSAQFDYASGWQGSAGGS